MINVASSDNVQAKTIIACEGLGVTLAISPDTLSKIQHRVCPQPELAVISFLKAKIGYAKNDTISHLEKSNTGLRFLALASALITTETIHASRAIHSLIENSAVHKRDVPTFKQITEILGAIHGRCLRAGYAEEVVFWRLLLEQTVQGRLWPGEQRSYISDQLVGSGVEKLVEAFREIYRIGDAKATKVVVRTLRAAPWVAAFTKWCLGIPPMVVFEDGKYLFENFNSKVEIIVPLVSDTNILDIALHTSHDRLSTLLSGHELDYIDKYFGMVKIETYGKVLSRHHYLDDDFTLRAIELALSYGLRQIRENINITDNPDFPIERGDYARGDHARLRLDAFSR